MSCRDGLNRNKVGVHGCEPLEDLFRINHPLQFLNLKGTSIGISGLECILSGLSENESLVSLNIAQNDLGKDACALFPQYLSDSHMEELVLSSNPIGNSGIESLSDLFSRSTFRLKRIDLSSCNIKSFGIVKFLVSL